MVVAMEGNRIILILILGLEPRIVEMNDYRNDSVTTVFVIFFLPL